MATLTEIRQKHPEYADMSDQQLAEGLHKKFYSDMAFDEFAKKVGYADGDVAGVRESAAPPATLGQRAGAVAGGFNSGVAAILGIPADLAQNLVDLGGAAYGTARSKITGESPADVYQIPDRSNFPLTGAWFAKKMDSTPLGPVTGVPRPDDTASRYLGAAGSALPAALTMRPANLQQGASAVTQTAIPMVAAQAAGDASGGDPAMQIGAALLGQMASKKVVDWAASRPQTPRPTPQQAKAQSLATAATKVTGGGGGAQAGVSGSVNVDIKNPGSQFGHVGPDESAGLTRMQKEVMRRGMDMGMRLTPGQATGSRALQQMEAKLESQPMTSGPFNALKENNARITSQAASRSVGEEGPLDSITIDKAFTRIGKVFDNAADDVPRTIDPKKFLEDYAAVADDMRGVTKGFGSHPLVEDYIGLATKGSATGKELQTLTSKLGRAAKKEMTTGNGDRDLGLGLYRVKDQVDDLLASGMKGEQLAEFTRARTEYRNLMNLTSRVGVLNPATGDVSGRNLANVLQMADKRGFLRDQNRTEMYDAARFAKAFGPAVGDSGAATRSPIQGITEMAMRIPYNVAARAYTSPLSVETALKAQAAARATGDVAARAASPFFAQTPDNAKLLPYIALIEQLEAQKRLPQ